MAKLIRLTAGQLKLSACWINIMGPHCHHSGHIHPLSTISGTFYLNTPPLSGVIKFEDPRLGFFMASPPRRQLCQPKNKRFHVVKPRTGDLLLFESWLRHEVTVNENDEDRLSISFNYDWLS